MDNQLPTPPPSLGPLPPIAPSSTAPVELPAEGEIRTYEPVYTNPKPPEIGRHFSRQNDIRELQYVQVISALCANTKYINPNNGKPAEQESVRKKIVQDGIAIVDEMHQFLADRAAEEIAKQQKS